MPSSFFLHMPLFMGYALCMKVLIFGSKGYMGGYFRTAYPDAVCPSVDIADPKAVGECLDAEKPDVVINCAGKTGVPNVDWCEDHKSEVVRSNVYGPLVLLEECGKRNIYWVHLGSGCVYEGDKGGEGFSEEDPPNYFGSFYSRSKGWIDSVLQEFPVLQLRLRMPFDGTHEARNLITKVSKYTKVLDAENSITYVPHMLKAAVKLIEMRETGTFNVVNPGTMSPYRLMTMYKEMVDPDHTFERLTPEQMGTVAKAGRSNCVISIKKLESRGITMPPVEQAVREALAEFAKKV